MGKELVTETPCWYCKTWTADFVKVTNKACFFFGKTKSVSEYVKLAYEFLLMQAFLRQNIMIDSGSRLCDI